MDCDKLGHKAYLKGTHAYEKLVQAFGAEAILDQVRSAVSTRLLASWQVWYAFFLQQPCCGARLLGLGLLGHFAS